MPPAHSVLSGIEQILTRLEQKINSLLKRPQSLPRVKTEEVRSPLQVQQEQTNETKFVTVTACIEYIISGMGEQVKLTFFCPSYSAHYVRLLDFNRLQLIFTEQDIVLQYFFIYNYVGCWS